MRQRKWKFIACELLLLLCAAITSCTDEDRLSRQTGGEEVGPPKEIETPNNVTIQFQLQVTGEVGGEDVLTEEMEGFTIFLFDGKGVYLRTRDVERTELLANNNTVSIAMDPGTYHMVCWGNARKYSMVTHLIPGKTTINSASILHTYTEGGKVVVAPNGDALFYAPADEPTRSRSSNYDTFDVPEEGTVRTNLNFIAAHKKLRIYIDDFVGTDDAGATDCPHIRISTLASGYDFLMQPVVGAGVAYQTRAVPEVSTRSGNTCPMAYFNTPLFGSDDQLYIDVVNPADGDVRLTLDLIGELKKQNIVPEDRSLREIRIDIAFVDTCDAAIKITFPEWEGITTTPGLN